MIEFSVRDSYGKYGNKIIIDLKVGDTNGMPSDWNGVYSHDGYTRLEFSIETEGNKKSKITFRK